ncbi:mannitol dehydrogenase family protein [Arcanobacterium wilhelmae]|uniref:mannitol dehydrogenase family protein n=1 Tax=Arcanobacterium wilhelmae TaxID=1803177 RepID=UPI0024157FAD|nr:mannitol dehydrogenase family protein [Arcanobacterium wilhelmae]WFN90669.1 mannitol dehydrogenase family protein [Arcanobacterium wilhelmae]
MKLTINGLAERAKYEAAGVSVPSFDVATMQQQGKENPRWVHIGPGNIFRIFLARIAHDMIANGEFWPIAGVLPMQAEELDVQLAAHDLLTLGVTLNPDGSRDLDVIAGLSEAVATRREEGFARFVELMEAPSVTLCSFTVTEKGYAIHDSRGELQEAVREAFEADPLAYHPHTMVLVAGALYARFNAGATPITMLSTDNFSHNGDKLRDSILTIARGWEAAGSVPAEFVDYVADDTRVAFPISVIDKITPRPSEKIATDLAELGFTDMGLEAPFGTPLAGFVNGEPTEYLIIEDKFAAPRPPLEEYGAAIVDRQVCDDFENMKVTTCLNPLHTALAISGTLLGYPTIDAEMRDGALAEMVRRLGYDEGLPVVTDPGIVAPADFLREVLEVRFPNRFLPDQPQRIAMDTSQKLPIRYGETIKKYIDRGLNLDDLEVIPLVFALWARYLMGVADDGAPMAMPSDPLLEELMELLSGVALGGADEEGTDDATETPDAPRATDVDVHAALEPLLSNPTIFGVNLYETPLAAKAEALFARMITKPGAVRATLNEEMNA